MNKIEQQITAITKKAIEPLPIVFPVKYGQIYMEIAKQHNLELHAEDIFAKEMLDEKMVRHIISLCECGDQALDAMLNNNMEKLKEVIEETKKLRFEIYELQKIVYEDPLTKSYTRKWFDDTYLANHDRLLLRGEGTLVLIDINKFKAINDIYGHLVGDKVLAHVALKLKESGGRVVRYGGDEFLLIFDQTHSLDQIENKMKDMLNYWKKTSFKTDQQNFKISFAYGIAIFTIGSNVEDVINTADKAMYLHKTAYV
ncbi:GGDEF domain-containing protein [Sulfuricurvum sp.]|uniref:GGDEF domain-containing protein n=1 Tax=Sulfuricurvum sp. TaxID=2025608 RepID=UPI0026228B37|nr:GGDEF domain-containing protein [Sulfuricurvum sp.]MDD3595283.1 GGDEF domain-containing protein [Sulfuricurvum sp.]